MGVSSCWNSLQALEKAPSSVTSMVYLIADVRSAADAFAVKIITKVSSVLEK